GTTTGAPLGILIQNTQADSSKYEPIKDVLRPGHANFTYLEKYGVFDYRGGGRASARETACRVAAGAVAEKILVSLKIKVYSYLISLGPSLEIPMEQIDWTQLENILKASSLFVPEPNFESLFQQEVTKIKEQRDSLGGVVGFSIIGLPKGLGDPVYEKLEANLAKAMMSIPASKGFEVGLGFKAAKMLGSQHNDTFIVKDNQVRPKTNQAGGLLGGISTGEPLNGRVAFKPTSSIFLPQQTTTKQGESTMISLPEGSRHDPCLAIRAVPVVEAMCSLVIADAVLMANAIKL
ncbi:MAG: chorismate synthase, partial [Silvanigrellaceae bacterium]|nr:chorismate synthase [Silvanigrellaceae bacterium]